MKSVKYARIQFFGKKSLQEKMGKKGRRKWTTPRSIKEKNSCNNRFKKALQKAAKTRKGISGQKIMNLSKCSPRFIGCFSEKVLSTLKFFSKPVYLMVHIGDHTGHWIALGIFPDKIEVFDPLGFKIFDWPSIPCSLLNFLYIHSTNKKLLTVGKVQPDDSHLCGFYCLFYIYNRPFLSLKQIESLFPNLSSNDKTLASLI